MRRSRRNIPDPSATEPPQQFASEASSRLKERVFEVADRESHMPPIDEMTGPTASEPAGPDKIVEEVGLEDDSSSGGGLWVYLLAFGMFMLTLAAVTTLGMCLLGVVLAALG
jgi:hypothetical protein